MVSDINDKEKICLFTEDKHVLNIERIQNASLYDLALFINYVFNEGFLSAMGGKDEEGEMLGSQAEIEKWLESNTLDPLFVE